MSLSTPLLAAIELLKAKGLAGVEPDLGRAIERVGE